MENKANKIIKLIKDGDNPLTWLVLGSLISADSNLTDEERRNNICYLEEIKKDIDEISDTALRAKILKFAEDGIRILKEEMTDVI